MLFVILFGFVSLNASESNNCATPSQYVMQHLSKSTTLVTGGSDWTWSIQKNNVAAHTIFARTYRDLYTGIAARFYFATHTLGLLTHKLHTTVDAASGYFALHNNGDSIEVISTINDTEVQRANTPEHAQELRSQAFKFNGKEELQEDACTKCKYVLNLFFNESTRSLEKSSIAQCATVMPIKEFFEQLNKSQS